MDLVQSIQVEQCSNGDYRIDWGERFEGQPVRIFAGPLPTQIDKDRAVVEDAVRAAKIPGLSSGLRHYFFLQPVSHNGVTVAERNVPLQGAVNFRDLGGYATGDGRRVDWARLFRSGHLTNLTTDDVNYIAALDIQSVCDLRVADEIADERTTLFDETHIDLLGIPPGVKNRFFFHRVFAGTDDPEDVVEAMHAVMRSFILDSAPRYARLFEVLLEGRDGAVLINCSAGKERTGVGSALVLMALGVPRETILYDFMLSKAYFPAESELGRVYEKYAVGVTGPHARRLVMPLLETRESYLQSAFDAIDEHYGSGDDFLKKTYGLGEFELRHLKDTYTH